MKLIFKVVALWCLFTLSGNAQQKIFKPLKEEVYYKVEESWSLSGTYLYAYNKAGDQITKTSKNALGVFISKDSLVYRDDRKLLESYYYIWDPANGKWQPSSKEVNCYNEQGGNCGSSMFLYQNGWVLNSATEEVRSFPQSDEEEVKMRMYESDTKQWNDITKYLIKYDAQRRILSQTYSFIDPVSKNWTYSSRITYNGWLDFENDIHTQKVTEDFKNNAWVVRDSSSYRDFQDLWIETRKVFDTDGSLKETLQISKSKDGNFREVMKASGLGWLLISSWDKVGLKETTVVNTFDGDQLLSSEKSEYDLNNDRKLLHSLNVIKDGTGEVVDYFETDYELIYDENNNLADEIRSWRNKDSDPYKEFQAIVYSDYIELDPVTSIEEKQKDEVYLYPNPNKGLFNIRNLKSDCHMEVINPSGIVVFETDAFQNNIDLSHLSSGIYLVKIINNETVISDKLVIE
ncbi:T9SS type A sorting domain-containing protein [Sporocytophaga myxococcoides]|uniref:T9SS type A sorting domain-containing protein n=1 Tax=Sporocytophaga myxococcoides TaxID=153721 RepID=UPI0003FC060C|nr:T9SS type A sorting domain-containing protein [Sporocytophaga myxococcoides]